MSQITNRTTCLTMSTLLLAMLWTAAVGRTIYVDDDGSADFDNIQMAINAANDGDIVEIRPGTYTGDGNRDIDFGGRAITLRSTEPNDPNVVAATVIDCKGTSARPHRGFKFHRGEGPDSVLSGLTITNGYGPDDRAGRDEGRGPPAVESVGGAIYCEASSPTISHCRIIGNSAYWYGGGIACWRGSNPTISYCLIMDNWAIDEGDGNGGGMSFYEGCSPTISHCDIMANRAEDGGGMKCVDGQATISHCTITGNSAFDGGGIDIHGCSDGSCPSTIVACIISSNQAWEDGGGIRCGENVKISHCVIIGNLAYEDGGGVLCDDIDRSRTISNCTITGNEAYGRGGGICCKEDGRGLITNCILRDNSAPDGPELAMADYSRFTVSYSDVHGGRAAVHVEADSVLNWGSGNIDADPFFVDPQNADFHLKSRIGRWDSQSQAWIRDEVASSCIDAGDPDSDWKSELWPHGKRINMGAYGGTTQASMSPSDLGNIADLNGDGAADFGDFGLFASRWLRAQVLLAQDFDRDGIVAYGDLDILADRWLEAPSGDEIPPDYPVDPAEGFETGNFSKFQWEHSGDATWAVTSWQKHSGAYGARAGSIDHDENTTLRVTLDRMSGNITFYRKVSSEAGYDYLKFYIDGVEKGSWSGEEDWAQVSFGVTAGTRTFEWTYSKDGSVAEGDDTAWIDDIVFPE